MTSVDPDRLQRYFFMHIQKTAGTALRLRLMNHFGEEGVYPTRGLDGTDPLKLVLSIDHLLERLQARGEQIKVITGHFPLRTTELIPGRFRTLTLLREPVERTLSFLRFQDEDRLGLQDRDMDDATGSARERRLEAIYDDLHGHADNNMTKMLSLTSEEMSASMFTRMELDRTHLGRAEEALTGINAVGLQENFEDYCDVLAARFGWRLGEPETVNTTAPVEVPESFRARIAEDNALDIELYEFAKRLIASDDEHRGAEAAGVEQ